MDAQGSMLSTKIVVHHTAKHCKETKDERSKHLCTWVASRKTWKETQKYVGQKLRYWEQQLSSRWPRCKWQRATRCLLWTVKSSHGPCSRSDYQNTPLITVSCDRENFTNSVINAFHWPTCLKSSALIGAQRNATRHDRTIRVTWLEKSDSCLAESGKFFKCK